MAGDNDQEPNQNEQNRQNFRTVLVLTTKMSLEQVLGSSSNEKI